MLDPADAAEPWLGGLLRLAQSPRGAHRAGTDAALLSRLLIPEPGAVVCDVGAGIGAAGLGLAILSPGCRVVLVERDPRLADLARSNVAANGLGERASVIEADVFAKAADRSAAGLTPDLADIALTNPPFFEGRRHRPSPHAGKAVAHDLEGGSLDDWLRACVALLKPGGRLGLIHRADALPACLDALANRFGAIVVRPVHARLGRPAIRVLITAVKGSRGPFALEPPLVLQEADGAPTREADALHRGEAWPPA